MLLGSSVVMSFKEGCLHAYWLSCIAPVFRDSSQCTTDSYRHLKHYSDFVIDCCVVVASSDQNSAACFCLFFGNDKRND